MKKTVNLQISLSVPGSRLNERCDGCLVRARNNFIANVVSQNVVVFGECVNRLDIQIQKIGRPSRRGTVNGSVKR